MAYKNNYKEVPRSYRNQKTRTYLAWQRKSDRIRLPAQQSFKKK